MKVPGPTVEQLVPWVEQIQGEAFRYFVKSRSSDKKHLVDLTENCFYGQCDCEDFRFNLAKKLRLGIPRNNSLKCYHIKQATRHFTETMIRGLWVRLNQPQTPRPPLPPQPQEQVKPVQNVRPPPKTYYLKQH